MALQREKFIGLFLDEFRDNLQSAENQILIIKNDPGNPDALASILRLLHTMKGSARMLQFPAIEKLVHGMEELFKGVREGRYGISDTLLRFFFSALDALRFSAQSVQDGGSDSFPGVQGYLDACKKLSADEPFDLGSLEAPPLPPETPGKPSEAPASPEKPAATAPDTGPVDAPKIGHSSVGGAGILVTEGELLRARQSHDTQKTVEGQSPADRQVKTSIRVDSALIDSSINLVNTLSVRQLRLRSATEELESIDREIRLALGDSEDIRSLKRRLSSLLGKIRLYRNQYSEHLFEIELGTQELRDTVIGMRMVPLNTILDRFPRMVEELAGTLGKKAHLSIEGSSLSLDRAVINRLQDPLIHLVRNAIDHGLEDPAEREACGKDPEGSIIILCQASGNRISVTVQDDGHGLDYGGIRERAKALWPDIAEEISLLPDEDLGRFLFRPGFSTKKEASEISGRGIGLDIVKSSMDAVKGQIQLDSVPGAGSRFKLIIPTSASVMDGMFVKSGGQVFFIPASTITRTLLVKKEDCFKVMNRDVFTVEGINIPLSSLSLALGLNGEDGKAQAISVLLVRGPVETIGLSVERILGYDSLVFQALPPSLSGLGIVQGVVFDESFRIIPILNMWALLDRLKSVRAMDSHKRFGSQSQVERPMVLVVDDSSSTREIEMTMLELEGFSVIGAEDGLDALDKIRGGRFDLVVSDIDMPRMDGFKLLENIRRDPDLGKIPVIFVSTWNSPDVQKKARELGANRYIFKSSFDQDNLVDSVRELLAEREAGG